VFRRSFWRGVPIGIGCALVAYCLTFTSWHDGLNEWLLDGLFAKRYSRPTTAKIVLIGLDDQSLDEFRKPLVYLSPELAKVVRYVREHGAASVGLDLFVPSSLSTLPDIENPGGLGDARTLGQAIVDVDHVVLPHWILSENLTLEPLPQWQLKAFLADTPDPTDMGLVNLTDDPDRFFRRLKLLAMADANTPVPYFALSLLAKAKRAPIEWDAPTHTITVGDIKIPLDRNDTLRINYVAPVGAFPVVPLRDVLKAARTGQDLPVFRDSIVIIGVNSRSAQDYHSTPFANQYVNSLPDEQAGQMNGSEISAHVLATILDQAYITTPFWLQTLPLLIISGALFSALLARIGIEWGLLIAVAYYFVWNSIALFLFSRYHYTFGLLNVLLLGVMVYMVAVTLRWRLLRKILRAVKSQPIAKALEADPRQLSLGGEKRMVTVLFADVRGFTSFSERNKDEPQKVVSLLNAYFTTIVPLVEKHGGTLNQYMGDGIMVIYNAPENQRDHALRALKTAVAMVKAVQENQALWEKLGYPGMRIGVGLNTGDAIVGAVGAPSRLDYSAIGDTTNTAARIEAENKQHGTEILISERTLAAISTDDAMRAGVDLGKPIVPTSLKGKSEVPNLYAVRVGKVSVVG